MVIIVNRILKPIIQFLCISKLLLSSKTAKHNYNVLLIILKLINTNKTITTYFILTCFTS
jgi:hypothetical protein